MPDDDARIKALKREVKKLGEKHGGRFFLIIRKRVLLKTQNAYAGWERKRGAVTELIRFIKTGRSQFIELLGDRKFLRECKNLLVLDSDTRLSFCAAADLVSAAAHPLNKTGGMQKQKDSNGGIRHHRSDCFDRKRHRLQKSFHKDNVRQRRHKRI